VTSNGRVALVTGASAGKAAERAGLLAKRVLPFRAFEAAARASLGVG
jgi:NADP-dependent 3-hydroxy acid dehydrogenase YdfG